MLSRKKRLLQRTFQHNGFFSTQQCDHSTNPEKSFDYKTILVLFKKIFYQSYEHWFTLKSQPKDVVLPWETPAAMTAPEWIIGPS